MLAMTLFGQCPHVLVNEREEGYPKNRMGLEVEFDDAYFERDQIPLYWDTPEEGSLSRHGIEFTFAYPMYGVDIKRALRVMDEDILPNIQRSNSPNQSMHCHLDCTDLTTNELIHLIIRSIVVEPILFHVFGKGRDRNIFCLSHRMSSGSYEHTVARVLSELQVENYVQPHLISDIRYSSVNLTSLMKYGSLEFRMANTTYDTDDMLLFMNTLDLLKEDLSNDNIFDDWEIDSAIITETISKFVGIPENTGNSLCRDNMVVVETILENMWEILNVPSIHIPSPPLDASFDEFIRFQQELNSGTRFTVTDSEE